MSIRDILLSSIYALESFSKFAESFFENRDEDAWRGWENWLTVDILRRLNNKNNIIFYPYCYCSDEIQDNTKMDIFNKKNSICIEIKTNYLTDNEIGEDINLHNRIVQDLDRLNRLDENQYFKLLIVGIVFDAIESINKFIEYFRGNQINNYNWRLYNCSAKNGAPILLLAISNSNRLPHFSNI